ncbi:alpha-tocopherol transfer protein-like [Trichonephila clavipes]|uniref:Alpha-tocopherol transfer protein-like n=1 Tax=Trichonephila clavipes TaxID=2585209 RepID=A0A8X6UPQ2_TRICX|nr:alpha-tocopherol transfer protein-like [Trichonephila clavipes]
MTKKISKPKCNIEVKTVSKTIRREIDLFEDEGFRGKYLEKVYLALLKVPPTNVDAIRVFSTAESPLPSIMADEYEEIMKAKGFFPSNLNTLPAKFIQKAKEDLGETDETRQSTLEQFRKRILEEKKVKCPTDDEFLIQYLRARRYDVDTAIELLNNHFNIFTSHPEIFDKLDKEKMYKLARSGFVNVLPLRDNDGCLVIVIKIENWDPEDINAQVLICAMAAVVHCIEIYPVNQICGVRIIYDAKDYSFQQMYCFVPTYLPLIAKVLKNCIPVRFKSIHIVNGGIIFDYAWSLLSLLLSEKIKGRIFVHGDNIQEVHNYIPKELLPQEYGGEYARDNDEDWVTKEMDKIYDNFSTLLKNCYS